MLSDLDARHARKFRLESFECATCAAAKAQRCASESASESASEGASESASESASCDRAAAAVDSDQRCAALRCERLLNHSFP
jgi:hypothetical protein